MDVELTPSEAWDLRGVLMAMDHAKAHYDREASALLTRACERAGVPFVVGMSIAVESGKVILRAPATEPQEPKA